MVFPAYLQEPEIVSENTAAGLSGTLTLFPFKTECHRKSDANLKQIFNFPKSRPLIKLTFHIINTLYLLNPRYENMKILFIGDYSNLHATIADELRRKGHEATVLSDKGGYLQTHADIFLKREPGIKGSLSYLYRLFSLLPELKGYDALQLINPNFLNLRPGKIKYFFDKIKGQNGSVWLTLAGNDYYFVKACNDPRIFRFSEFKEGDRLTEFASTNPAHFYGWMNNANRKLSEHIFEKIDGAMSVLPEYDMAARPYLGDRLKFTNLPVNLANLPFSPLEIEGPIKVFVGMRGGMEIQKGTARLLASARELEREMPEKIQVESVRNLPLAEYLQKMKESHIVLDQLYSYSPATNALQAMAMGRVAASGGQPEFYEYIGNPEYRPVISLSPFEPDIKERLSEFAADPTPLFKMSRQGRTLVEKNNDVSVVTDKFIEHWKRK